jgi:type I restriction enzyme S subunit
MRASYPTYKSTSIPWLPEMPEHWEQVPLFSLIQVKSIKNRAQHPLLSVYRDYGVILKSSRDDNHNKPGEDLSNYKFVSVGDLVLNKMKTWQGSLGISKYDGIVSPAYIVCKVSKKVNGDFLHHLLRSHYYIYEYNRLSYGIRVDQWDMHFEDFKRVPVFLPPLTEQTAIANYLDAKTEQINRFIEKKQKLIALLKEQKQAVINELLEDKEGKWERRKLKFLAKVLFSNVDKHSIEGEVPVLLCNYTDVYKNEFIGSSISFMEATASVAEIKKFAVVKGDVLVTKDSETADDIANPALVAEQIDNLVCGYHLAQIRTGSLLLGEFLFRVLQSKVYNKHFEVRANGVTRVGLSIAAFTDFMVPLPSIEEQESIVSKIGSEFNRIDSAVSRIEKEIEKVKELKQSLIAEVVTGRIKVV